MVYRRASLGVAGAVGVITASVAWMPAQAETALLHRIPVITPSATVQVPVFESEMLMTDCNDNGIVDSVEITNDPLLDCNNNGTLDACERLVDIVFIIDTSSSMFSPVESGTPNIYGVNGAICEHITSIVDDLRSTLPVDIAVTMLTMEDTNDCPCPGADCSAISGINFGTVASYGTSTCGATGDDSCDLIGDDHENWGPSTGIIACEFPWRTNAAKIIIPVSDEGPHCGTGSESTCDVSSHAAAINRAALRCQNAGVKCYPITRSITYTSTGYFTGQTDIKPCTVFCLGDCAASSLYEGCVRLHALLLADSTGGKHLTLDAFNPLNTEIPLAIHMRSAIAQQLSLIDSDLDSRNDACEPTVQTTSFGYGLSFDGTDDYAEAAGNFDSSEILVEGWLFPRGLTYASRGGIATWGTNSDAAWSISVVAGTFPASLSLQFEINVGKVGYQSHTFTDVFNLTTFDWRNFAISYDGVRPILRLAGGTTWGPVWNTALSSGGTGATLRVGLEFVGVDEGYDGVIDELRIWNDIPSLADQRCGVYRTLDGTESGLEAYYRMDENTGQTVADLTGNGHTLTLGNSGSADAADPEWALADHEWKCFSNFVSSGSYGGGEGVSLCPTGSHMFTYEVCASGSVSYQWYSNGNLLVGETNPTYTASAPSPFVIDTMQCIATTDCGSVVSDTFTIRTCMADYDCSGSVDSDDFDAFMVDFDLGNPEADIDQSGFVDINDRDYFVTFFECGC